METLKIKSKAAGRLDQQILIEISSRQDLAWLTRSKIKTLIESQKVLLNQSAVKKAGTEVKVNDLIEIQVLFEDGAELKAYDFELNIVYEDKHLLVINKPAGLSMHPGAGNRDQTLVNALVAKYGKKIKDIGAAARPGLIHRLDKDTTGLVLVAKSKLSFNKLSKDMLERKIRRYYKAIVPTRPRGKTIVDLGDQGRIENFLIRDPKNRLKFKVNSGGRLAITNWQVLQRFEEIILLELKLETGRTHQIRVHLATAGAPIIGDKLYGNFNPFSKNLRLFNQEFPRQALHAYKLEFEHPQSKESMKFEVDLPADMQKIIDRFTPK